MRDHSRGRRTHTDREWQRLSVLSGSGMGGYPERGKRRIVKSDGIEKGGNEDEYTMGRC